MDVRPAPATDSPSQRPAVEADALLDRWVARGFIAPEQAERIRREDIPAQTGRPAAATHAARAGAAQAAPRASLVVEALGYLGGIMVLVAAILLVSQYWDDVPVGGRLALLAAVSAVLLLAARAVPTQLAAQGERLRWVLLVLSTGALAGLLVVAGTDLWDLAGQDVGLLAGGGVTAYAAVLWWREGGPLLQAATLGGALAVVVSGTMHLPADREEHVALAAWGLGVVWVALSAASVVRPAAAGTVLGSLLATFASVGAGGTDWGLALGLVTVAAVVALAVQQRFLILLLVGAIGTLQVLPRLVLEWFPGRTAAPLALLVLGVLLVASAVQVARRWRTAGPGADRTPTVPERRKALVAAGAVLVVVSATVVVLGL